MLTIQCLFLFLHFDDVWMIVDRIFWSGIPACLISVLIFVASCAHCLIRTRHAFSPLLVTCLRFIGDLYLFFCCLIDLVCLWRWQIFTMHLICEYLLSSRSVFQTWKECFRPLQWRPSMLLEGPVGLYRRHSVGRDYGLNVVNVHNWTCVYLSY